MGFDSQQQRVRQRWLRDSGRREVHQPQRSDVPFGGTAGRPARFRLIEVGGDWLRCHTWNGEVEGETDVYVAKPWLLRRTPFDGYGVSSRLPHFHYEFTQHWERKQFDSAAEDPFEYEVQVVVPKYVPQRDDYVGDLIVAMACQTDVRVDDLSVNLLELAPDSGRAWARKWTQEVETDETGP